jgi:hypothetical protein
MVAAAARTEEMGADEQGGNTPPQGRELREQVNEEIAAAGKMAGRLTTNRLVA